MFNLQTQTRVGVVDTPFRSYLDALGEAVKAARNGFPFPQSIFDSRGDLVQRIEPEPKRTALRLDGFGFESGSVVTPGLSPMGGTPTPKSGVSTVAELATLGESFDLAEGV